MVNPCAAASDWPAVLTPEDVAAYALAPTVDAARASLDRLLAERGAGLPVSAEHPALDVVRAAHDGLAGARARGAVYGLTTGVGALRHVALEEDRPDEHALRLWRSHAGGLGPELDDGLARATMLVRLHQLLQGGSGVSPELVTTLAGALARGAVPRLHAYGAIGTGDLTALAELGLTLVGETPWRTGEAPVTAAVAGDALPFISSNALTAALAATATTRLARLASAAESVAALSHLALRGSAQAYDARVHAAKDDPDAAAVARRLVQLLGGPAPDRDPARVQDPFGLRTVPQVHGPWAEALAAAERAVAAEIGAAGENPLVVDGRALHHGQFVTQRIGTTLDTVRAATIPALNLSVARLAALLDPALTALPAFLASGPAGSSGLMVVEYVANDLLSRARTAATGVTGARTVVSLGLEEHASHSTQAAWLTRDLAELVPQLLGCELVAAVRALRLDPERLPEASRCPARELYDAADAALPDVRPDHVLGPELRAAAALLADL